jgi:hypothetical protein
VLQRMCAICADSTKHWDILKRSEYV